MTFSNWPLYIEEDRGTLKEFESEYGTKIRYIEEINENQEFFGKVQKQYSRATPAAATCMSSSDYMAARMARLGYVQKLDKTELPDGRRTCSARLRQPLFDSDREFTVPSQADARLIYRKDKVKREPRSIEDLFDPEYKGKVDPAERALRHRAADAAGGRQGSGLSSRWTTCSRRSSARQGVEPGQVRRFTGNAYTNGHLPGRLVADHGLVRRRDPAAGGHPHRFRPAREGASCSGGQHAVRGAPHAFTAQSSSTFVYPPRSQVDITEWVNYVPSRCASCSRARPTPRATSSSRRGHAEAPTDLRPAEPRRGTRVESALSRA